MAKFEGQVVIITGAGSGIGRATAIKLARAGATLALSDINTEFLSVSLQECINVSKGTDQRHIAKHLDVRSCDSISSFVRTVVAEFGSINHVFNCAGVNPSKMNIEQITDEYWRKLVDTNLTGVFAMTRACVPHMRSGSSFVNVSSYCGLYPTAQFAVYCATKYGVIGFSKCMALELGAKGIRVNVIAPGTIDTPTNISVRAGQTELRSIASGIGLKRIGSAEEVADVVAFLFSEDSRYMNGSVVEVDGGIGVAG